MTALSPGLRLRQRLARPEILVAPGAYDGLSARLAGLAGAEAVYMTGFGIAGSLLGVPDIGLVTATEMAERVRALAEAAGPVPLIADGDNGHGGPLNAARLTRLYEQAGAACIQLEDQVLPKRCGHMAGKAVVPVAEARARIRAAVDSRQDRDFCIMARTDAIATDGLDEALRRAEVYLKAGADLLFIEAPKSLDDMAAIAARFPETPLVANMVEDGATPLSDARALQEIGFALVILPVSALLVAAGALREAYGALVGNGQLAPATRRLGFADYNECLGLSALNARAADWT